MSARTGPFFLYDPHQMPESLKRRFFKEFAGMDNDTVVRWKVDNPGGPFGESVAEYTVANYGDTIRFNLDVDAWLKSVGATPGETALIRFWW